MFNSRSRNIAFFAACALAMCVASSAHSRADPSPPRIEQAAPVKVSAAVEHAQLVASDTKFSAVVAEHRPVAQMALAGTLAAPMLVAVGVSASMASASVAQHERLRGSNLRNAKTAYITMTGIHAEPGAEVSCRSLGEAA